MLFLKEDDENFWINAAGLGGFVNDFGGGLAGADGSSLSEAFFGKTNEVTVIGGAGPVPANGFIGVSLVEIKLVVCVVAGVFRGKEGLDFGNRHAIIISHYCVADDVAGVKTLDGSGRGASWVASGEERKGGGHEKTKNYKNYDTRFMKLVFEAFEERVIHFGCP